MGKLLNSTSRNLRLKVQSPIRTGTTVTTIRTPIDDQNSSN